MPRKKTLPAFSRKLERPIVSLDDTFAPKGATKGKIEGVVYLEWVTKDELSIMSMARCPIESSLIEGLPNPIFHCTFDPDKEGDREEARKIIREGFIKHWKLDQIKC